MVKHETSDRWGAWWVSLSICSDYILQSCSLTRWITANSVLYHFSSGSNERIHDPSTTNIWSRDASLASLAPLKIRRIATHTDVLIIGQYGWYLLLKNFLLCQVLGKNEKHTFWWDSHLSFNYHMQNSASLFKQCTHSHHTAYQQQLLVHWYGFPPNIKHKHLSLNSFIEHGSISLPSSSYITLWWLMLPYSKLPEYPLWH
jgi:hypothetical protein